jgi:hypothetical protein
MGEGVRASLTVEDTHLCFHRSAGGGIFCKFVEYLANHLMTIMCSLQANMLICADIIQLIDIGKLLRVTSG